MNVTIPESYINSSSFVVQWDSVTDILPINYTVRWYGEEVDNNAVVTANGLLSYIVTELTNNTSYNVTVVANNICGAGLVSDVVMVTTNAIPPPTGM